MDDKEKDDSSTRSSKYGPLSQISQPLRGVSVLIGNENEASVMDLQLFETVMLSLGDLRCPLPPGRALHCLQGLQ